MFDADTLGFAFDMVHAVDAMLGQDNKTVASLVGGVGEGRAGRRKKQAATWGASDL
jgi:hypothetical protein